MTSSHQELLCQQQAYYTEITQEYNLEKEQGRNKIIVIFCIKGKYLKTGQNDILCVHVCVCDWQCISFVHERFCLMMSNILS